MDYDLRAVQIKKVIMKLSLFFITLITLVSCNSSKNIANESLLNEVDSVKVVQIDTISNVIEVDSVKEDLVNEMIIIRRDNIRHITPKVESDLINNHEKSTGLKVVDRAQSIDTNTGWIAYSVPEKAKVAKSFSVKVRISKKSNGQNKAVLILGQEDPINNSEYPSIATIEDIRVFGQMSAELRADTEWFTIVPLSTTTQDIDSLSYTEWEWSVTPKKSGESPLKLVIKIKELNKDIVVFNKTIGIKSNVGQGVESFFSKYWQWLMTTIIIPIFIYFWNKKKKNSR